MPIAQIWEKARVSSPYILESVECNMCDQQIKIRDVYDKICTKQRTYVLTKQHRSDRSSPARTPNWVARSDRCPLTVRLVRSSQST
jgi:hypothetical protein